MSSSIKRAVSETFASWLAGKVPALAGKIHAVQSGPNELSVWPCAALVANVLTYDPFQADEVWAQDPDAFPFTDDGKVVLNVGDFTGSYELRVYAKSVGERETLEEQVLQALLSEEGRSGIVALQTPAVTVGGFTTLYQAPCAFMLERELWQEEFAFENRRFSFIDLEVAFPALIAREAYQINQLCLAINSDLASDVPEENFIVNADGTTTEVP